MCLHRISFNHLIKEQIIEPNSEGLKYTSQNVVFFIIYVSNINNLIIKNDYLFGNDYPEHFREK